MLIWNNLDKAVFNRGGMEGGECDREGTEGEMCDGGGTEEEGGCDGGGTEEGVCDGGGIEGECVMEEVWRMRSRERVGDMGTTKKL